MRGREARPRGGNRRRELTNTISATNQVSTTYLWILQILFHHLTNPRSHRTNPRASSSRGRRSHVRASTRRVPAMKWTRRERQRVPRTLGIGRGSCEPRQNTLENGRSRGSKRTHPGELQASRAAKRLYQASPRTTREALRTTGSGATTQQMHHVEIEGQVARWSCRRRRARLGFPNGCRRRRLRWATPQERRERARRRNERATSSWRSRGPRG